MLTAVSKLRGHRIYFDGDQWRYCDNGALTATTWRDRPCGFCGELRTKSDHDHCLGELPGVANACCGHGEASESYVQFSNGSIMHGNEAAVFVGLGTNA